MTSSISSGLTLDNIIKANQISDTAMEKIKETFSKDKENVDTDEEVYEESEEESAEDEIYSFDYTNQKESSSMADYIKNYTSAVTDYLTYLSENKTKLGESPLKDVLKNKFKVNISKSAYENVGMSEYYNLKNLLKYSQSLSSNNNNDRSNVIRNFTNFTISV